MIKFDVERTVSYWLEGAQYDLGVANAITHSLPYLAENSKLEIPEAILVKLREFMEFHFEARYPHATKIFYKKCTKAFTAKKLEEIREVFKWVKAKL
jgi:HEPN domain-containing protein